MTRHQNPGPCDEVEYTDFRAAFVQTLKEKQTDQYNYTRLQYASQEKDESPEIYSGHLRKLCQRTVQQTENPVEQAILNREAEKRLLEAFISGLNGVPGRHAI
jgi:DNA-binding MurR/RpiR family transcriptional regulator